MSILSEENKRIFESHSSVSVFLRLSWRDQFYSLWRKQRTFPTFTQNCTLPLPTDADGFIYASFSEPQHVDEHTRELCCHAPAGLHRGQALSY